MGFSRLDSDDIKIEIIRLQNEGLNYSQIARQIGVDKSSISRFLNKNTHVDWWAKNDKPIASGSLNHHHEKLKRLSGSRFIFTSAQNSTFVHSKFLKSLENMASYVGAQIIVGTFSYNKSGFQNLEKGEGSWFDSKIEKYILDEPVLVTDDLIWCGELNILPTAVNPLQGLFSYTMHRSGIVPHVKVQLEPLPRIKGERPRSLFTTGTVTKRNYIQKVTGQKAEFHHVFGALYVEVDSDGDWFARQLIADSETGEFYDLDTLYTPEGVSSGHSVEAIQWGDLHVEKKDPDVYDISFISQNSLLDFLKPKYQFCHDTLDFEARNHHNIKDPYFRYKMWKENKESVADNIRDVFNTLKLMNRPWCKTVVVESNHDLAIERWLKEADYKTDPANAIFFLQLQLAKYESLRDNENLRIFEYALSLIAKESKDFDLNIQFLDKDESFKICNEDGNGIECGSHGHLGNDGGKGSVRAYQQRGSRYNVGHTHSARIKDGVYYAGVSGKLDMGYNSGGTTWSHSHIITYKNGKRAIVTINNGKYRANN